MAAPRRTVFRDYFVGTRLSRFTVLRDHEAARTRRRGPAYRALAGVVGTNSKAYDAVLGVPAQLEEDWLILRDRKRRRLLWRALVDEKLLTEDRRKALMSILFWATVLVWAAAGIVVAIFDRASLGPYHAGWSLFFYSLATSIFLPTPFEVLLSGAVAKLGVAVTVAVAALAKTAGSWIVLLMGDKANEGIKRLLEGGGVMASVLGALERFAHRYGYVAIFILFAIPFMADTAPLFALAVLRMKKAPFLAITFVAVVVRSLLYLYAGATVGSIMDAF